MIALQTPEPHDPLLDPPLTPPPGHHSNSILERVLRRGWFGITAELNPPDSADPRDVLEAVEPLRGVADAINATDASGANCHMSSMGICALMVKTGLSMIQQISCRDRNRIAIQGDVLGAAAMGVNNILCLTGDGVGVGDQPGAKPVFDFDSISALRTLKTMRDEGVFLSGRPISTPPKLFLGAAENPCVPPYETRAHRLAKKLKRALISSKPTTCSTSPDSSVSWMKCVAWACTSASSLCPGWGLWQAPRRPDGCGRTYLAFTFLTRSLLDWRRPNTRRRKVNRSALS